MIMNLCSDAKWLLPFDLIPTLFGDPFLGEIFRIQGYDIYKTSWSSLAGWGLASLMVLLATWKIAMLAIRWYQRPCHSPLRLFRKLMRQHRLNREESKLMHGLAKRLPDGVPLAALFLDPTLWPQPGTDQQGSNGKETSRLEPLFEKLFGLPKQRIQA